MRFRHARVTGFHDALPSSLHAAFVTLRRTPDADEGRVYLARGARADLARMNPSRRAALSESFLRVGRQLLVSAERVAVEPGWSRHTWPRRRYPQQCYPRTVKYVLGHLEIAGMRLVHGVVSHAPHFMPFDHAWVELPGDVVFDAVVQTFFTRASYLRVMTAVVLDAYSAVDTRQLVAEHGHPGPWNASWVPTVAQLEAYVVATRHDRTS
jgi:hypothetical protein